ncbi:MAG TPA: HAD hydrolase family protein [Methylomirabilota bacterium]|jgi:3-deoxy-D-manno-octulosonate 8-phosphate phosphatase (KDO 8-P phosphatase)|nr:HAD hydrolase family protein [Methylomirabilota bacterium]
MAPARRPGAPPPRARLRRIRLLILDVDGVLTDGRVYYGPDGAEWKSFDVHDGLALARAAAAEFPVAVISSRNSEAVARRCAELGIREVHQGVGDKLAVYEGVRRRHGCTDAEVACMGDDLADLPLLRRAGLALAPADAVADVRRVADWVSRAGGGRGAVREVLESLLRARGMWAS